LEPLILNVHGELEHVGKRPTRASAGTEKRTQLIRLRREMAEAVTHEDYELATQLRDQIRRIEAGQA
jgi:protein arginine kinase activator